MCGLWTVAAVKEGCALVAAFVVFHETAHKVPVALCNFKVLCSKEPPGLYPKQCFTWFLQQPFPGF